MGQPFLTLLERRFLLRCRDAAWRRCCDDQGRPSATWRDAIYYAYYENAAVHNVPVHDGVRTERYKLMFFPRTREWNLFDLEEDKIRR